MKNEEHFTILDFIIIIDLLKSSSKIIDKYPFIKDLFDKLTQFKINMFNEKLNIIDGNYSSYDSSKNPNKIIQFYFKLFNELCTTNDGLLRHIIPFYNNKIIEMYYNLFSKNKTTFVSQKRRIDCKPTLKRQLKKSDHSVSSLSQQVIKKSRINSPQPLQQISNQILTRSKARKN